MSRRTIIAGNWKMNMRTESAGALAKGVVDAVGESPSVDVALCPPAVLLSKVSEAVAGTPVGVGAQNLYAADDGAFTGEVNASMLTDVGCRYVILGHSERRTLMGETDAQVSEKLHAALAGNLIPDCLRWRNTRATRSRKRLKKSSKHRYVVRWRDWMKLGRQGSYSPTNRFGPLGQVKRHHLNRPKRFTPSSENCSQNCLVAMSPIRFVFSTAAVSNRAMPRNCWVNRISMAHWLAVRVSKPMTLPRLLLQADSGFPWTTEILNYGTKK